MLIYLYVKRHKKTGLKYFGMTTQSNPRRYVGSGIRWKNHLKQHGRSIETLELWEFTDQESCTAFALDFSKRNNIVESAEWANLIDENGVMGGIGFDSSHASSLYAALANKHGIHPVHAAEVNKRRSAAVRAHVADGTHNSQNPEILEKRRQSVLQHLANGTHNTQDAALNKQRSKTTATQIQTGQHQSQIVYTCPFCKQSGRSSFFSRKHFDNCTTLEHTKNESAPSTETV